MLESQDFDYDADDEFDGDAAEWAWSDDLLVRRLRTMKWAEATAEVRERCWVGIKARMAELEEQGVLSSQRSGAVREVNLECHGFTRRPVLRASGFRQTGFRPAAAFRPRATAFRPRAAGFAAR